MSQPTYNQSRKYYRVPKTLIQLAVKKKFIPRFKWCKAELTAHKHHSKISAILRQFREKNYADQIKSSKIIFKC